MNRKSSSRASIRVDGHYLAQQARQAVSLFFAPFRVWENTGSRRDGAIYIANRRRIADYRPHQDHQDAR